jgi:hypothetical protein
LQDQAKLERLRSAAKEGFDEFESGGYETLRSDRDVKTFMRRVAVEVAAKQKRRAAK